MFLKSKNKSQRSLVNTDHVYHIATTASVYKNNPEYYIRFVVSKGNDVEWFYKSEEEMVQEFDWIMDNLEAVQNK